MKPTIHLFIDFENHQPPPADFEHVHDTPCQIWLFHGPHQNRFSAEVVTAWQPLGKRVRFIQSSRNGKNALDFHIAHALGMAQQQDAASGRQACYVVVSNDSGFDALFDHMRSLGAPAGRAASIPEALALAATLRSTRSIESAKDATTAPAATPNQPPVALKPPEAPGGRQALDGAPRTVTVQQPSASQAPPNAAPVKQAPVKQAPAKQAPAKQAPAKQAPPKQASATVAKAPPRDKVTDADVETVLAGLRNSPRNRPADRNALQRHIVSLLRNEVSSKASDAVIGKLEASKAISFNGKKVEYKLPTAKAKAAT